LTGSESAVCNAIQQRLFQRPSAGDFNYRAQKPILAGHTLAKCIVIVIPAGMPHWFKEVPQSISYYVVKVIK